MSRNKRVLVAIALAGLIVASGLYPIFYVTAGIPGRTLVLRFYDEEGTPIRGVVGHFPELCSGPWISKWEGNQLQLKAPPVRTGGARGWLPLPFIQKPKLTIRFTLKGYKAVDMVYPDDFEGSSEKKVILSRMAGIR